MKFLILTLFPEMFQGPLSESIIRKARDEGIIDIDFQNIRDSGKGKHKQVDDIPYGGGAGMVMRPDVIANALRKAKDILPDGKIIAFTPRGKRLTQQKCEEFAWAATPLILLCGHYEGIDERIYEMFVDEEISLGDFVLTGGEIPTMALIDSVTRLLPGAVGNEGSTHEESFSAALRRKREYPHYTRPEEFEGNSVPEVLLSGHHAQIQKWRENHLAGLSEMEKEICGIRREYFSSEKPWKARKILFREPIDSDKEFWMKWLNDEEVVAGLCMDTPYTRNDADERFEYQNEDLNGIYLTILDNVSQKPIGSISITVDPDHEHRGNLGMYLGEKKIWGQGYASAAIQEILKTGFELLKLEKITLEVFQENIRAVAMYERCGFRKTGEAKRQIKKRDGYHDVFYMEILRSEWEKNQKGDAVTRKYTDFRGGFEI